MIARIEVNVIPSNEMRYTNNAGDYYLTPFGDLRFDIVDLGSWKMEACILLHEIVEYFLVVKSGIAIKDIDAFDMSHPELDEPGADPRAPYHRQHMIADWFERALATLLGVEWDEYEAAIDRALNGGELGIPVARED